MSQSVSEVKLAFTTTQVIQRRRDIAAVSEHTPLAALADRVGYRSASAFSTAFTRFTGSSPSDFARQSQPR
jgi:AraC-like DNA-binding protein